MQQLETVAHVDAIFGGKEVRFELPRDRVSLAALEQRMGSLSAAWGRFIRSGDWLLSDVRAILALAHPELLAIVASEASRLPRPVTAAEMDEELLKSNVRRGLLTITGSRERPALTRPRQPVPDIVIDRVLSTRPVATYAPLAGKILHACFMGLPAPLATFDERDAPIELQAQLIAMLIPPAEQPEAEEAAA